jgi:hypothetical protein
MNETMEQRPSDGILASSQPRCAVEPQTGKRRLRELRSRAVDGNELGEIVALQEAERRRRRRWGRWQLRMSNLTLWLRGVGGGCLFEMDLEEITTCADLVAQISYASQKTFMRSEEVGDLVRALDDIFDIQESFAGVDMIWGWKAGALGRVIDPAKMIRSRMRRTPSAERLA